MTDDTPDSLIPYDEIVQEALRAVVGRVLGSIVSGGGTLPGAHHFYITFKTGAPGVNIPPHLRERFPDEMTIVLQNKFWEPDDSVVRSIEACRKPMFRDDDTAMERVINTPTRGIGNRTVEMLREYARDHQLSLWGVLSGSASAVPK